MNSIWKNEYSKTASHKFKNKNDVSIPFLHAHSAILDGVGVQGENGIFKIVQYEHSTFSQILKVYISWGKDLNNNENTWSEIEKLRPHCAVIHVCLFFIIF